MVIEQHSVWVRSLNAHLSVSIHFFSRLDFMILLASGFIFTDNAEKGKLFFSMKMNISMQISVFQTIENVIFVFIDKSENHWQQLWWYSRWICCEVILIRMWIYEYSFFSLYSSIDIFSVTCLLLLKTMFNVSIIK